MKTVCIVVLSVFCISSTVSLCNEHNELKRIEHIKQHALFASIKQFVQEHKWCLTAIAACLGYIYVQNTISAHRYNGPLAEAHKQIEHMETVLQFYGMFMPQKLKNIAKEKGLHIE